MYHLDHLLEANVRVREALLEGEGRVHDGLTVDELLHDGRAGDAMVAGTHDVAERDRARQVPVQAAEGTEHVVLPVGIVLVDGVLEDLDGHPVPLVRMEGGRDVRDVEDGERPLGDHAVLVGEETEPHRLVAAGEPGRTVGVGMELENRAMSIVFERHDAPTLWDSVASSKTPRFPPVTHERV